MLYSMTVLGELLQQRGVYMSSLFSQFGQQRLGLL
jgi:hypothetical protein